MQRRLIAAVFVALLAFAQHAALAHGIWHAWQAAHAGPSDHTPVKLPGCDFDAVYGEVLGTSGAVATASVPPGAGDADEFSGLAAAVDSASPLTPRSRGPPALS